MLPEWLNTLLLARIAKAKDAVEQLGDAPKGHRRNIVYALDSADQAGDEGDSVQLLEKPNEAQNQLLKFSFPGKIISSISLESP